MSKFLNDVNSSINNIECCISDAGSIVLKSRNYGRVDKDKDYSTKLKNLEFIKTTLQRYKDTVLTENCVPLVCGQGSCFSNITFGCDSYFLNPLFISEEQIIYSSFSNNLGKMIIMTSSTQGVRLYSIDNNDSDVQTSLTPYFTVPTQGIMFLYSELYERYVMSGHDWIYTLDTSFNVIQQITFGGGRTWGLTSWSDDRNEIYLPDGFNDSMDVVSIDTLSLTSTTVFTGSRVLNNCIYDNDALLVIDAGSLWHFNLITLVPTLKIDALDTGELHLDFTNYYQEDRIGVVITNLYANYELEFKVWKLVNDESLTIMILSYDLDLPSFGTHIIDSDACGNIYISNTNSYAVNEESVVVYDRSVTKQDSFISTSGYKGGLFHNPANNKLYLTTSTKFGLVLTLPIDKVNGNQATPYPSLIPVLTEVDICNLMKSADRICSSICN